MENLCDHFQGLTWADFPVPKTPNGVKNAWRKDPHGCHFVNAKHVVTWVAAIPRQESTQPAILPKLNIRLCVRCRQQAGHGAMFMRRKAISQREHASCGAVNGATSIAGRRGSLSTNIAGIWNLGS